jgi:hypothetical protein
VAWRNYVDAATGAFYAAMGIPAKFLDAYARRLALPPVGLDLMSEHDRVALANEQVFEGRPVVACASPAQR